MLLGDRKGHEGMIDPRDLAQLGSGKSANLGEKTITENGEYSAADDELDGYKSVNVTVESQPGFTEFKTIMAVPVAFDSSTKLSTTYKELIVLSADNGEYTISDNYVLFVGVKPAKKIVIDTGSDTWGVFSPSADWDNFYPGPQIVQNLSVTGDTIVPNDGKTYTFQSINGYGSTTVYVKKLNVNWGTVIK